MRQNDLESSTSVSFLTSNRCGGKKKTSSFQYKNSRVFCGTEICKTLIVPSVSRTWGGHGACGGYRCAQDARNPEGIQWFWFYIDFESRVFIEN